MFKRIYRLLRRWSGLSRPPHCTVPWELVPYSFEADWLCDECKDRFAGQLAQNGRGSKP